MTALFLPKRSAHGHSRFQCMNLRSSQLKKLSFSIFLRSSSHNGHFAAESITIFFADKIAVPLVAALLSSGCNFVTLVFSSLGHSNLHKKVSNA
jgi:hypothetical protein